MSEQGSKNASAIITMAAIVVVVYGMQAAKGLLVPFLIAVFLALITVRPMLWMQSKRVPAVLAALIIVIVIMMILFVTGTIVGRSLAAFTAQLPLYEERLDGVVQGAIQFAVTHLRADESIESIGDMVDPGFAMSLVAGLLNALRDVLTNTFLIFIVMIFMLLEASGFRLKIYAAFGESAAIFEQQRMFLRNLGRYLGIKTIVSVATGFLAWLLTWSLDVEFPLLWGMLAFLLNYVPTVGSIIAAVPAVLMALIQLGYEEATAVAIGFVAINIAFGNFIEPRLMGYGVGISPLVVIIGLIFWGFVFGPVGMLLSVPLTMTLKMGLESDESTRWIAILLGSTRDAQHHLDLIAPDEGSPDAAEKD